MRAALIYHLASDASSGGRGSTVSAALLAGRGSAPSTSSSSTSSFPSSSSLYSRAADAMVAQHLRATGRQLSLSVFVPEAGMSSREGTEGLFLFSSEPGGGGEGAAAAFDELAALCRLGSIPSSVSSSSSSPPSAWPKLSRAIARSRRGNDGSGSSISSSSISSSSFARELLEALASTSEGGAEERERDAPPRARATAAAADNESGGDGDSLPSALLLRQLEEAREFSAQSRVRELRWKEAALAAEVALDEALEAAAAAAGGARRASARGGGGREERE